MSPRTREQNEEIRKQRKQEIMQAAISVYVDKGYAASEMGEIANRAGLAHGLVYYYFKSKKALFRELYEYMMEESKRFTKAYFEQTTAPVELFRGYARILGERVLENPAIPRFYARIGLDLPHLYAPDEVSPFEWVSQFMQPMTEAIERGMSQGLIPPGDARLMAMQFWGAVSHGTNYLDQEQQELTAREVPASEKHDRLNKALVQIVESAVSIFRT